MSDNKDPLKNLLLDADDVDRNRLAAALQDILGIDTKTGRIVLKPGFNQLTARKKMAAYLLGRKVALLLEKTQSETASVKEIQAETSLPRGTVGPKLRELAEARLISQTEAGEYYIGPTQISAVIGELKEEKK
jgi:hypothetical protein